MGVLPRRVAASGVDQVARPDLEVDRTSSATAVSQQAVKGSRLVPNAKQSASHCCSSSRAELLGSQAQLRLFDRQEHATRQG